MVAESALPALPRIGYHRPEWAERGLTPRHAGQPGRREEPGMMGLIVFGIVVVLVLLGVGLYNGLVRARVRADEAWSGIATQLKRRHDLIPNLVETVKGYAAHEKELGRASCRESV